MLWVNRLLHPNLRRNRHWIVSRSNRPEIIHREAISLLELSDRREAQETGISAGWILMGHVRRATRWCSGRLLGWVLAGNGELPGW